MSTSSSSTNSDETLSIQESPAAPIGNITAPTTTTMPATKKERPFYPRDKASRDRRAVAKEAKRARDLANPPVRSRPYYDRRPPAMAARAALRIARQQQNGSDVLTPAHGPINDASNTHNGPPQIDAGTPFPVDNDNKIILPSITKMVYSVTNPTINRLQVQQTQPMVQMRPNTPLPALTRQQFDMHAAYSHQQQLQQQQVAAQNAIYQQVVNDYAKVVGILPVPISDGMSLQVYIANLRSMIASHKGPVHVDPALGGYYSGFGGQRPLPTYSYPAVANMPAARDIASAAASAQDNGPQLPSARPTRLFAPYDCPPYYSGSAQATGTRFHQAPARNPTTTFIPPPAPIIAPVVADRLLERMPTLLDPDTAPSKVTALTISASPTKARQLVSFGMDRVEGQKVHFPVPTDITDQGTSTIYAFTGYTRSFPHPAHHLVIEYTILCWKDGLDQSETWSLIQFDPTEVLERLSRAPDSVIKMEIHRELQGPREGEDFWVFCGAVENYLEALRAVAKTGDVAMVKEVVRGLNGREVGSVGREVPIPHYWRGFGEEEEEEEVEKEGEWGDVGANMQW